MKNISAALNRHTSYVKNYPVAVLLVAACCGVVLYTSWQDHNLLHAVGYIAGAWLCCLLTDIAIFARPMDVIGFPVKKPLGNEVAIIMVCTLLGSIFLVIRFFTDWQHLNGMLKLATLPLLLFTFPIVLALVYLFRYKYKPKELGINLSYWYLPLILHIVWGAITLWVAPEKSHWKEAYTEYGVWGSLFTGIITAALPEEFVRMLMQTRFGQAFKSIPIGMVTATAIWGAMHIPVGYSQNHEPVTLWRSVQSISYLMPLGIYWGYLTQRTKSLLPAVMMHGFNLWGLQNF